LLAALAGLVLAAVLAALTALTTTLATLMLLAGPVLSALSALAALAAALLRSLLLLVTLRVVLLVRHWEILRCLFGNAPPPPQRYQRPAKTKAPKAGDYRYGQRIVTAE
jgi:hypothetical protein